MEMSFERNIAFRGWHLYGKTVWQNTRRGKKSGAKKKKTKRQQKSIHMQSLRRLKDKLVSVVIGHIPREISRFAKLFINYGGRIEAKVFSSQYKPSPMPSEGLEISPCC